MCCFSRPVRHVGGTRIFARSTSNGGQYLAYQMTIESPVPVAMILPIPTPIDSKPDAVRFLNLEKMGSFFNYLDSAFPQPQSNAMSKGGVPQRKLDVVSVGSFVASFVPKIADFSALDEQFRLPTQVWEDLPQYKIFGFVVFQLKPGKQKPHPMAFEFPRRRADRLFFPTVHIHDGKVHEHADFDHELYCQRLNNENLRGWEESGTSLAELPYEVEERFFKEGAGLKGTEACKLSGGILKAEQHVYRKVLKGSLPNQDFLL